MDPKDCGGGLECGRRRPVARPGLGHWPRLRGTAAAVRARRRAPLAPFGNREHPADGASTGAAPGPGHDRRRRPARRRRSASRRAVTPGPGPAETGSDDVRERPAATRSTPWRSFAPCSAAVSPSIAGNHYPSPNPCTTSSTDDCARCLAKPGLPVGGGRTHAHPTIAVTEAASGIDREAGLRPALESRVIELDKSRIRFTHPLLAAGAYRRPIGLDGPRFTLGLQSSSTIPKRAHRNWRLRSVRRTRRWRTRSRTPHSMRGAGELHGPPLSCSTGQAS